MSLFFAFHISCQGWHLREKLKDFTVNFFAALIKHEICKKCDKCIVSVSYFVVCFAKTFAKYEKCIAGLRIVHTQDTRMCRVSGTIMGPVFLFVFDRLDIDHYLTRSSSIDGKFHALHRYTVEICKKLSINYILRF